MLRWDGQYNVDNFPHIYLGHNYLANYPYILIAVAVKDPPGNL